MKRFSVEEVRDIYKRAWQGDETYVAIADEYGVTSQTVSNIAHRRNYAWVDVSDIENDANFAVKTAHKRSFSEHQVRRLRRLYRNTNVPVTRLYRRFGKFASREINYMTFLMMVQGVTYKWVRPEGE